MAVNNRNGKQLDLAKIRASLIESRDKGTVSKGDYRKAMKGLDKISDAGKKGIDYQFTADNRFRTVSVSGAKPTLGQAGVGVNTRLPVFGRNVSKAMGFAAQLQIPDQPKSFDEQKEETLPPSAESKKTNSSSTQKPYNPQKTNSGINLDFSFDSKKADGLLKDQVPGIEKKEPKIQLPEIKMETDKEAPIKLDLSGVVDMKKIDEDIAKKLAPVGFKPIFHDGTANAGERGKPVPNKKINQGYYDQGKNKNVVPVAKPGSDDFEGRVPIQANDWNPVTSILKNVMSAMGKLEELRKSKPPVSSNKQENLKRNQKLQEQKLANGGKVKILSGGGKGFHSIQDQIQLTADEAMKKRRVNFNAPIKMGSASAASRGFALKLNPLKPNPKPIPGVSTVKPYVGDRKTLDIKPHIEGALNENAPTIDKDSAINTALGLYGAASLATAKRPTLRAPKELNLFIRPAQGDEDMVSRSSNAIAEGVRQGTGMLRSRAGSDIHSYVQGATAMVDSQGKNMSAVLGQNAQIKRADEDRMGQEINAGKQMNWQSKEQFRQEQNLNDQNSYAQRVAGAQGAVNNALNFGVQKRADERNKAVELKSANARYGTMMLSLADALLAQGYTPEQVAARLENVKKVSKGEMTFKNGGKITSERMAVNAHTNLAKSTQEMRKILAMYTKFVSDASIQNIREFNKNIRAINDRKNITITRR